MSLAIRDDARLAGEVIRYHTWPHTRQQSVGEHSWQVCRILMSIAPAPYWVKLLPHTVTHDIGEIGTGDVPYPVKANNPELGRLFDELEHETVEELCDKWGLPSPVTLTPQERWVFKLAEFIEMWEWGLEELQRGNQFARKVADRCREVISKMLAGSQDESVAILASEYIETREEIWK